MTKTLNTFRFTPTAYGKASAAFIAACNGIDLAINGSAKVTDTWGKLCAAGIQANSLTLDAIKSDIIKAYNGAKVLGDCGSTVKGRYYALARIEGAGQLDRLVNGEAFHTVARDCKPQQEQAKGKAGKGKGSTKIAPDFKLASFADSVAGVLHHVTAATKNTETALALSKSDDLAALTAAIAKLLTAAEHGATKAKAVLAKAAAEKAANAKANAKLAKSKAKAVNVAVIAPLPKGRAKTTVKLAA